MTGVLVRFTIRVIHPSISVEVAVPASAAKIISINRPATTLMKGIALVISSGTSLAMECMMKVLIPTGDDTAVISVEMTRWAPNQTGWMRSY